MIRQLPDAGLSQVLVRRYAAGKVFASMTGNPEYAARAEAALQRSLVIEAVIDVDRFLGLMRAAGVPDEVSADFLESSAVGDEAWLQDVMPG